MTQGTPRGSTPAPAAPAPPAVPVGYAGPATPAKVDIRPGVLKAFGGISVGFALLQLGTLFIAFYLLLSPGGPLNRLKENQTVYLWITVGGVVRILLGAALLAGAMGLLSLKRWSRPVLMTYALLMLAVQAVDIVITLTLMGDNPAQGPALLKAGIGWAVWMGHALWCVSIVENKAVKAALGIVKPKQST